MSWMPGADPELNTDCPDAVEVVIVPRTGDLGEFEVRVLRRAPVADAAGAGRDEGVVPVRSLLNDRSPPQQANWGGSGGLPRTSRFQ